MADPLAMWLQYPFAQAVESHINSGLWVFPLHGIRDDLSCTCGANPCGNDNKNSGKHPYTPTAPHGFKNATNNIETAAELFQYRTDLNIGVATGEKSRIFVIDVDNKNNGTGADSLGKMQEVLGELPETMMLTTGNGYHLVFDYPEGENLGSNKNSFGFPDVDTRGNGGYIVIYPSRHFSGRYYERDQHGSGLADLPPRYIEWLRADHRRVDSAPVTDRQQRSGESSEWSEDEIQRMLDCITDIVDDYDDWLAVGMALHREGCPMDMWDGWSSKGMKYAGIKDIEKRWRGFNATGSRTIGTIVEWAMIRGWRPEVKHIERMASTEAEAFCAPLVAKILAKKAIRGSEVTEPAIAEVGSNDAVEEYTEIQQSPEEKPKTKKAKDHVESTFAPQFSFNPLELPGPLGETIRWITKHSIYDQPELAMLNTLAFAGAVFGRRYASPIDTRTNIYLVGIARTGGGKDHSRKMINTLALETGLSNWIGGNSIRSDTGMLRGLANNASQLLQLDEFGIFMQGLSDKNAGYHVKCISKALMSLYSDSNGVYHHGDYADEKAKPIKIAFPNLCIYGTTTEDSYTPALKRSAIKSGELNRFLVIPSRVKPVPKRYVPKKESNEPLVAWWSQFAPTAKSSLGLLLNNASGAPKTTTVEWGECEERQYLLNVEQSEMVHGDSPMRDLWSRLYENTLKLAMIFAIARDPVEPVFMNEDFDYAYSIARVSIDYMASLAEHSMMETPQEQNHHEVLQAIAESGTKGVSRRELLRRFRKFKKKELDDLVGTMVEEESVVVDRVTSMRGGNPIVVYYATTDNSESR